MDMSGSSSSTAMGSSSSMSDSMSGDMGTFHWGTSGDGLWINTWIPKSEGAYIGACFGIFFMAILSRSLPALETYLVTWRILRDRKVYDNQLDTITETTKNDIEKKPALYPSPLHLPIVPAFSWTNDTIRSLLSTFSAFISYLLMMVVMTGNGGFFFVIIGGVFIGEIAFGRYKFLGGLSHEHGH